MSLVSFRRTVSYNPPCALIQVKHMEGFWNDVFDGALYNCHHQNKKIYVFKKKVYPVVLQRLGELMSGVTEDALAACDG